ncbi:ROK family transcriptional regulator [Salinibacterium sp. G-O1]|uniref:ROK family transcriptional regulator n=1 Tax=Salinibacterium sp. G-O1 TaxID=3046208 RepID=UPI0032D97EFD
MTITEGKGSRNESVRRDNLSTVLGLVHRSGGLARSALTVATGLNRSTIAALVAELVALELVTEGIADPTRRVGRPSPQVQPGSQPVAVAVNPEVDAITVGLVGLSARVEHRVRHEMDHPATPEETARIIADLLTTLAPELRGRRLLGIGLAVPGLVRARDGIVRWAPHLDWTDAPLAELVESETGVRAYVGNDASLGALAEHLFGVGRDVDDLVYINGGASGIGGGVIVGGQPLGGVGGYAGEFGQNRPGVGRQADRVTADGTVEVEVSRARLLSALEMTKADEPELHSALLASTDHAVHDELARQRRILSVAISNAINVLNPSQVVLGGFLADLRAIDAEGFDALVSETTVPAAWSDVSILPAELGADLLLIGAAELVFAPLLANPAGDSSADEPRWASSK